MADIEKPKRKSVAFSDGTKVVDEDGQVTEMNGGGEKNTAESHSAEGDAAVDEVTVRLHSPLLTLPSTDFQ
jgi:translation initiation factor 2 subunit 2